MVMESEQSVGEVVGAEVVGSVVGGEVGIKGQQ